MQLQEQVRGRGERVREERDGPGVRVLGEQGAAAVLGGESQSLSVSIDPPSLMWLLVTSRYATSWDLARLSHLTLGG